MSAVAAAGAEPARNDATVEATASERTVWQRLEPVWVPGSLILGLVLGFALPLTDKSLESKSLFIQYSSAVIGWVYFCAWSVSFWPQVVLNASRRSVVGLSLDYQLLNFVGFVCYFLFNASLYWSPDVQEEYREHHDGKNSAVKLNDVMFAGHAALLTTVTLLQICFYYDYPRLDRAGYILRVVVLVSLGCVFLVSGGLAIGIVVSHEKLMTWLSFLSFLSLVKVMISVVKYCPQVWMNYQRKSTEGWNIYNVLLDFIGGSLSVLQLIIDAEATSDWSAVTGDPAKFLLGNLSMFFDIIFMIQHYCLYRKPQGVAADHDVARALDTGATEAALIPGRV